MKNKILAFGAVSLLAVAAGVLSNDLIDSSVLDYVALVGLSGFFATLYWMFVIER